MRLDAVARICKILPDVSLPCVFLQQEINFWITLSGTSYSLPGLRLCTTFLGNSLEQILDNGGYLPRDAGEQASARGGWEWLVCLGCEDRH